MKNFFAGLTWFDYTVAAVVIGGCIYVFVK